MSGRCGDWVTTALCVSRYLVTYTYIQYITWDNVEYITWDPSVLVDHFIHVLYRPYVCPIWYVSRAESQHIGEISKMRFHTIGWNGLATGQNLKRILQKCPVAVGVFLYSNKKRLLRDNLQATYMLLNIAQILLRTLIYYTWTLFGVLCSLHARVGS